MTIKLLKSKKINIYEIHKEKEYIYALISTKDLKKINKLFKITITKEYGLHALKKEIIKKKKEVFYIFFILVFIFLYSHIIIRVSITSTNTTMLAILDKELEQAGILPYRIKISEKALEQVKEQILENQKDKIEWLNIEEKGMQYIIKIQPKMKAEEKVEAPFCDIVAKKEGTITKIISSKGKEVVEINSYVHEGDILISGTIDYNNEIKNQVCSEGKVYATTWYTIQISLPKKVEESTKTGKKRGNILVTTKHKKWRLKKEKYAQKETEIKKEFHLFGFTLTFIKEYETKEEEKEYTQEEIELHIKEEIEKHMKNVLKEEGKIINQKVLKKTENNSKIDMTIFIVAEEQIGVRRSS